MPARTLFCDRTLEAAASIWNNVRVYNVNICNGLLCSLFSPLYKIECSYYCMLPVYICALYHCGLILFFNKKKKLGKSNKKRKEKKKRISISMGEIGNQRHFLLL